MGASRDSANAISYAINMKIVFDDYPPSGTIEPFQKGYEIRDLLLTNA